MVAATMPIGTGYRSSQRRMASPRPSSSSSSAKTCLGITQPAKTARPNPPSGQQQVRRQMIDEVEYGGRGKERHDRKGKPGRPQIERKYGREPGDPAGGGAYDAGTCSRPSKSILQRCDGELEERYA